MSKKKHKGGHEEEVHMDERWIVSYADILTLLLALFIVMFAMSKVDQKKFEEFAAGAAESMGAANVALAGKTGSLDGTDGILEGQKPNQSKAVPDKITDPTALAQQALAKQQAAQKAAEAEKESLQKLRDKIRSELAAKGLKNAVEFQLDERGLVVNIVTDKVLFDTGQAEVRPDGAKMLDVIAPLVEKLPNRVTVEGHTDNVPISGNGKFPSNWELSTDRAGAVLRVLIADGLSPSRVSAAGYADQRPLASNTDEAGRARNRRVAIVVLPKVTDAAAAVTATDAAGATGATSLTGAISGASNSSPVTG